jgi:hypothetical protein
MNLNESHEQRMKYLRVMFDIYDSNPRNGYLEVCEMYKFFVMLKNLHDGKPEYTDINTGKKVVFGDEDQTIVT